MRDVRSLGDVDWEQVFPAGDHRWTMGVRRVKAEDFFIPTPDRAEILSERTRWLADDPAKYAALLPEAVPALDETIGLLAPQESDDAPYERLLALGRRCEPDLIWLLPTGDGSWRVVGGIVCFPSSWALTDKLGRSMPEVHGPVPKLNASLGRRIDAFLTGFDAQFGWHRINWSLSRDVERNHHPSRRLPTLDDAVPPEDVSLRLEHQLLLRLPQTAAVLFTLQIQMVRLTEIKRSAAFSARLAHVLETMLPEVAKYKNVASARWQAIGFLKS